MDIIELLEKGKIRGYEEEIPEVISTGSSHVFIFRKNNIALKVYRRDNKHWNTYFADMSEGEPRKKFIKLDYEWNHFYSPDIYWGLKEMKIVDEQIVFSSPQEGDELVMEMKIVDDSSFLMNVLCGEGVLSNETFTAIGRQVAEITSSNHLKPRSDKNFYEIAKERVTDVMSWAKSMDSFSEDFMEDLDIFLRSYVDNHREKFENITEKDFVNVIDCHSANAVYVDGKISFVDILLPKELWRVSRINDNFSRIGTDIKVLRGEEAYEAYKSGFVSITSFDNSTEEFDLIYYAFIMLCAQTAYAKKDKEHQPIADKYYSFIEKKLGL